MKHLFIINPVAGGRTGNSGDVVRNIESFAETLDAPYEIYITKEPMDASRKITQAADELEPESSTGNAADIPKIYLYVYACGGDGTLNECVNGAAGRAGVAVTHYPCGTGNDFIKTFPHIPAGSFNDLSALAGGEVKALDVIECISSGEDDGGACVNKSRFGLNICSVGIDARVGTDVHKYSRIPVIGGKTGYTVSLIVNVIKGITQKFRITCSGIKESKCTPKCIEHGTQTDAAVTFDREITLACACNGRFYGGGFNPVPDALPDDGILECLVVEPVSRLKVAGIVGQYAKGLFSRYPDIFSYIRCREMEIGAGCEFVINIDGEGIYAKKIIFRIIPKGVNFIFPKF